MSRADYSAIAKSVADTIAKGGKPLTDSQYMLMVCALSVWIDKTNHEYGAEVRKRDAEQWKLRAEKAEAELAVIKEEIEMTIAEIKREPRNKDTLELLKHILQQVEDSEDATEVLAFVKIGKDYHRFSAGIADMMKLIAVLEVAKHDCISRMTTD